jgi:predicted enzyme related to lactoylglutathione lyase
MAAAIGLESLSLTVSHIWLYVKDTQKSIQFYRDAIGLKIVETFPDGALLKAGEILIGIHREETDRKSLPGGTSIILNTENIQKDYDLLRQRGVSFLTRIEKKPYGLIASLKDPDGYLLELWEPR